MPTRSTIRYAAKRAYQLGLMVGRYESYQCGLHCAHDFDHREMIVTEFEGRTPEQNIVHRVPIAKAWINL